MYRIVKIGDKPKLKGVKNDKSDKTLSGTRTKHNESQESNPVEKIHEFMKKPNRYQEARYRYQWNPSWTSPHYEN